MNERKRIYRHIHILQFSTILNAMEFAENARTRGLDSHAVTGQKEGILNSIYSAGGSNFVVIFHKKCE